MAELKFVQLGEALVEQGFLTAAQLSDALAEQKRSGRMLGRVLVENNYVTDEQVAKVIALQQGIAFVDLRRAPVLPETAQIMTELQARRFQALVLEDREGSYLVGMVNPSDLRAQDELSMLLGRPLDIAIITARHFSQSVERIYRKSDRIGEFAKAVERDVEQDLGVVDIGQADGAVGDQEAPVSKLLEMLFSEAVQMHASDIHIEPQERRLVVRFRIDGVLRPQIDADPKIASALMVRLKLMAGLDIAEKRLPQDGRIAVRAGGNRIDVRLSTIPAQHGESVVMRLLVQNEGPRSLDKSGMPPALQARFEKMIKAPHGLVLVTGPTGSGKSSTLYGALQMLNRPEVKIVTCEDPVEYHIPGITQVQVNDKIDLSFARVLRAFLRQDPDILLVGEIRDHETAQITARAAMTGHLVLSTLHTNDALSTPARLLDMGLPGYMIASTLLGVVSQRLLRLTCPFCAEAYSPTPEEMEWLRHASGQAFGRAYFRQGTGCSQCNEIGYHGRVGIFELLEMTAPLAAAIHRGDPVGFEQLAKAQLGNATLQAQAVELAVKGRTTIAEAMSVVTASNDEH